MKNRQMIPLILLALGLFPSACGTLEIGIEHTAVPDPVATVTPFDPATPIPTVTPLPTQPTMPPTSTPLPDPSSYLSDAREGGSLGSIWTLADLRYGLHPDRVQVVLEMAEPASQVPFFQVVEVENATSPFPTGHDPSWGEARIDLVVSDLYARNSPIIEQLPLTLPGDPVVTRIGLYPTFSDAHLGFSIGLKEPAAYEVYELTDPVRIVITVLYPTDIVDALVPTPTPYLDYWVSNSNPAFAISLEYPVNWQPEPGYGGGETGETRFAGDNGFFHVNAMDAATIDDAAANEAEHHLQPYGSQPSIESLQIQGQEARLILPSEDQPEGMGHQAALIIRYPQPVNVLGTLCHYFVLWADYPHIRTIAQTLQFSAVSPPIEKTPRPVLPTGWENLPPGLVYSALDGLWLVGSDERPVQIHNDSGAVISADGTRIISYDHSGQDAWLLNRADNTTWNLTRRPDRVECCFQWWPERPDVTLFYSTESADSGPNTPYYLSMVNTDGEGYQVLDAEHNTNTLSGPGQFAPSPDGQTIAYSSDGTGWLYRWGGAEIFDPADYGLFVQSDVEIAQPAWSPDGTRLAWIVKGNLAVDGSLRAGVALFDLQARTAQVLHPYESQGAGWPSAPVWSTDGQWLAFGDGSPSDNAGLWVARAGDPLEEYHLGLGGNQVWSPDGQWLAFGGFRQDGLPAYMLVEVGVWTPHPLDLGVDRYSKLVDWINP
ncbi:MAG: hypothetical protein GY832_12140 [Chloroflexi bacterium]|nr:hypothetical protein [Chloroflexota bacterium]